MTARPPALPDHASERDDRQIAIDQVGIRRLRYPITVKEKGGGRQQTVAEIEMTVALPADVKGTHMSRFIEVLEAHRGEVTISTLPTILTALQRRLEAETVGVVLDFPYFLQKAAPVSQVRSMMDYACGFRAQRAGQGPTTFELVVRVPVKSLCPCSKAISAYGAHNQRSLVEVVVAADDFIWIEDVVAAVEGAASAPVYALLKRADEKWVTEQAYDNPRFVEDLVREVLIAVRSLGARRVQVTAENFESIHNHSAFARLTWSDAVAVPAVPRAPEGESVGFDFGVWLKQARQARGLSQGDLADKAGCSRSYLSRIEANTKGVSAAMASAFADALGVDPVHLALRAGVVSEAAQAAIAARPEAFLAWMRSGQPR
jgi:GTP cyclohydrolase I